MTEPTQAPARMPDERLERIQKFLVSWGDNKDDFIWVRYGLELLEEVTRARASEARLLAAAEAALAAMTTRLEENLSHVADYASGLAFDPVVDFPAETEARASLTAAIAQARGQEVDADAESG